MRGLVWSYTFNDGVDKLKEIETDYHCMKIRTIRERKTKNEYQIKFDNGDIWQVVGAKENAKGFRANISYVDTRINPDFVNTIIRHCTSLPPYNAIIFYGYWPEEDK